MTPRPGACRPLSRRAVVRVGGVVGCAWGLGAWAVGARATEKFDAKRLVLRNAQTREELDVEFRRDRALVPAAIAQIDALLCDPATRERHPTDPGLLDELHALASTLGAAPVFDVICAYRAPSREQLRPSLHALGRAIDVRLAGVDCADLAAAALAIARGGVGYYRAPNFVHLDTGAHRSWRG